MTRFQLRSVAARTVPAVAAVVFALALAPAAFAEKSKSTQSEATWVSYDAASKSVVLKIDKPGKGPNRKMMKKNKDVSFRVVPEGSVLKRTSVTVNAQRAEIGDIPAGKKVLVYWVPDEENDGGFFARKIDVVFSEEELDKRYPDAEE